VVEVVEVLLLPFLEQHRKYHLYPYPEVVVPLVADQPWASLEGHHPEVFRLPSPPYDVHVQGGLESRRVCSPAYLALSPEIR